MSSLALMRYIIVFITCLVLQVPAYAQRGSQKNRRLFVQQLSLNDYYVSYQLKCLIKHPNKQAGIEIMSPRFYALRDGQKLIIPENKSQNGNSL